MTAARTTKNVIRSTIKKIGLRIQPILRPTYIKSFSIYILGPASFISTGTSSPNLIKFLTNNPANSRAFSS